MRTSGRHLDASRAAGRWIVLGVLACAAVLLALAVAGQVVEPARDNWLFRALTSPLTLICAAVMLACAAALALLGQALWLAGARGRAARRSEEGAAILEFVMVLPIALMIILIMVQSMLLMVGNLCVHYSAYAAARTAIVAIPDDYSPTEPPNHVSPPGSSAKQRRIKLAACWALMPVSSSSSNVGAGSTPELTGGLGRFFSSFGKQTPYWVQAHLAHKMQYAEDYTELYLDPPKEDPNGPYERNEDIHVTVRHTFYLAVPYAGKLFSEVSGGVELPLGTGEYGMEIVADCSLTNEGESDIIEIELFPPDEQMDDGGA